MIESETVATKTSASEEIARRKTFAIISHPDAGKTTLTEKLLLYSGVLREAGTVKAKAGKKHVTSDWMELERKRGISVTTTAIQFEYNGFSINLLDTPGHKDFSEDTYRTLMAVDSAVMLIDAAKGVEAQTRKLFQVCRQAGIPIFTFINKMDREAKDALALLDEIENVLGISCSPANWPLGSGQTFAGVYSLSEKKLHVFDREDPEQKKHKSKATVFDRVEDLRDQPQFQSSFQKAALEKFFDEIALLETAMSPLENDLVLKGLQSPVFFGSAMNNFGIEFFLDYFTHVAPAPVPRVKIDGSHYDSANPFSGVIFKIQANMDPQHRDSLAFMRICSGAFERGVRTFNSRTQKEYRINNAFSILGRERTPVEHAVAGDVIGLVDTSSALRIGDTLAVEKDVEFRVWTRFLPEVFADIRLLDPDKRKQLARGLEQLSGEGIIQCLSHLHQGNVLPTLGAIGQLQFDVLTHRLEAEYGVHVRITPLSYSTSRLVVRGKDELPAPMSSEWLPLMDADGNILITFASDWSIRIFENTNKGIQLGEDYSSLREQAAPNVAE